MSGIWKFWVCEYYNLGVLEPNDGMGSDCHSQSWSSSKVANHYRLFRNILVKLLYLENPRSQKAYKDAFAM